MLHAFVTLQPPSWLSFSSTKWSLIGCFTLSLAKNESDGNFSRWMFQAKNISDSAAFHHYYFIETDFRPILGYFGRVCYVKYNRYISYAAINQPICCSSLCSRTHNMWPEHGGVCVHDVLAPFKTKTITVLGGKKFYFHQDGGSSVGGAAKTCVLFY